MHCNSYFILSSYYVWGIYSSLMLDNVRIPKSTVTTKNIIRKYVLSTELVLEKTCYNSMMVSWWKFE